MLEAIDAILPHCYGILLIADRVHTGEPFLICLDDLQWYYAFRASESTQIEHPTVGWMALKRMYKRANTRRYLSQVQIWKQGASDQHQHLQIGAEGLSDDDLVYCFRSYGRARTPGRICLPLVAGVYFV